MENCSTVSGTFFLIDSAQISIINLSIEKSNGSLFFLLAGNLFLNAIFVSKHFCFEKSCFASLRLNSIFEVTILYH